jgi:nucleotide-binding universal stress UspA family protein
MNVLLAVDGSEPAETAAREVASRPWPRGTTVRVVYVAPTPMLPVRGGHAPPAAMAQSQTAPGEADVERALVERDSSKSREIAEQLQANGFDAHAKLRHGDASSEIVEEAKAWPADLIVIGSHGYTGFKRLLLGSVAEAVVRHAPCSVEVVRRETPKS